VLAIWGALVIGGVYMLRAIRNIWHGEKAWPALSDPANFWRKLPYGLLLACLICWAVSPIAHRQHHGQRRTGGADGVRRTEAGIQTGPQEPAPAGSSKFRDRRSSASQMNLHLIIPEMAVVGLALAILLADLWTPAAFKPRLGWVAAAGLVIILAASFFGRNRRRLRDGVWRTLY
jgi:hypothetical protein